MIALLASLALSADFDRDHAALAVFLDGAVHGDGVDYDLLATRRATLDGYLDSLHEVAVDTLTEADQLAFWVNAYNGWTIRLILDERPKSIMDLDGGKVWTKRNFRVGQKIVSLDDIENQHARPLGDGRVHAVLNCASRGCPPLLPEPLRGRTLSAQLDRAARAWAATNAYRREADTVRLSKVFDWYAADFPGPGDKAANAIAWLRPFVDEARRTELDAPRTDWAPYDWALNAASAR